MEFYSLHFLQSRWKKDFEQISLCAFHEKGFYKQTELKVTDCVTFLRVIYFQILVNKTSGFMFEMHCDCTNHESVWIRKVVFFSKRGRQLFYNFDHINNGFHLERTIWYSFRCQNCSLKITMIFLYKDKNIK